EGWRQWATRQEKKLCVTRNERTPLDYDRPSHGSDYTHPRLTTPLKLFVDLHLIAGDHLVGFVGHADYGHQLLEHFVGHTFFLRRDGVGGDAVVALVGDTDGYVDHLLRERIERAGRHDMC